METNIDQGRFSSQNNLNSDQPKKPSKFIFILLIVILAYGFGFQSGKKGFVFKPKEFKVINRADQPQTVDYNLLWDAIDVVNKKYIDAPLNEQDVLYGAIKGAVESAGDPYTTFFKPSDLENFQISLRGSFEGIGAEIGKRDGNLVIIAPLADTPAERAGILAKDIIIKVDGESTADWSVEKAVTKIRGPRGAKVILTIFREGRNLPFDVEIIRGKIELKSVTWKFKEVEGKKIAIIKIARFGEDTKALFDKAVNEILTKSADGIVLDLRNNPGGFLRTSVEIASNWISLGTVVVREERNSGEPTEYKSLGNSRLVGIKTVVLINGGSASASEILTGALQDYGIATIIGEKSFGKGSVQELVDLKDGSAVKVTIARWLTPNGRNINKDGLKPDIEVKLTEEDMKENRDPQLDKALEEVAK